jgi:hypothetical protein
MASSNGNAFELVILKEEFDNEKEDYAIHGQPVYLPKIETLRPARQSFMWHNETTFPRMRALARPNCSVAMMNEC